MQNDVQRFILPICSSLQESWQGHTELDDAWILGECHSTVNLKPMEKAVLLPESRTSREECANCYGVLISSPVRGSFLMLAPRRCLNWWTLPQHAADCALQHGQRILEAQEKAPVQVQWGSRSMNRTNRCPTRKVKSGVGAKYRK